MTTQTIKLPKGKYINQIEPFMSAGLDIKAIYHKTVTGCGISRFAIEYFDHDLIIIFPNVPVIIAKRDFQNELHPDAEVFGVYKGKTINHLNAYLMREDVKYKKILTTPEGFMKKVLPAFQDNLDELYSKYFIVYDECDRIITDVSYRGEMAAPIDEFVKFNKKALVSATTLPFSDPRLQDFNHFTIEPDYDYSKKITVIDTNNVVESLKKQLDKLNSDHICIFLNSTSGISAIAKTLGIEAESRTFCAEDSVVALLGKGYIYATDEFDVSLMKKYNFFTSRYFSAIDIEIVGYKPDIIMVSDVYFADHSILDPRTEVIQIAGRFRKGYNTLTHITNFNPVLSAMNEGQARYYLKGHFDAYEDYNRSFEKASNPGTRESYMKALIESKAHSFYLNGDLNQFMVDNFIYEERVKGYYQTSNNLKTAYDAQPKHFKANYQQDDYGVEDKDLFQLRVCTTQKEKHTAVASMLFRYKQRPGIYILFKPDSILNSLRKKYPEVAQGVDYLNESELEATGYVKSEIKKAVSKVKNVKEHIRVAPFVFNSFEENTDYSQAEVQDKIAQAYQTSGTTLRVYANNVLLFFHGKRSQKQKVNYYLLRQRKSLDSLLE
jgi:hypothetical protein